MSMTKGSARAGMATWYGGRSRRTGARGRSPFGAHASLTIGLVIVGAMMLTALLAGVLAPADPLRQDVANALAAPGSEGHLLGTDALGRDVLSRLL